MPSQKIGTIQTKKMKGLKETPEEKKLKQAIKIKEKKDKAEQVRQANISAVFAEQHVQNWNIFLSNQN